MEALHIKRKLESESLPELKPLIGKTVEVIVFTESEDGAERLRTPAELRAELEAECAAEGRAPVRDLRAMTGKWPGEMDDGFEDWVRRQREHSAAGKVAL